MRFVSLAPFVRAVSLWLLGLVLAVQAMAQTPTPEQLQMLQSLPPAQQQQLLERAAAAGVGVPGVGAPTVIGAPPVQAPGQRTPPQGPEQLRQRSEQLPQQAEQLLQRPGQSPPMAPALEPFGYEIFRSATGRFEPESAMPVPNDYVLGPGDNLEVQLYGNERQNLVMVVGRDGQIRLPKLGPVQVGGMSLDQVKAHLAERVSREFVGTQVSLSMGQLRSVRVFVLGDVANPGSYLVSALSNISHALLVAGGPTANGTLRDIQLKRNGYVVSRLDAYDLLLNGDTSKDQRLQAGDVVFVPPVGTTVAIEGEVRRAALYEVKNGTTVADLLLLSGGLRPEADPKSASISRINERRDRVTLDADLTRPDIRRLALRNGDRLEVGKVRPTLTNGVELAGAVFDPRVFEYRDGLRISAVLPSDAHLRPEADAQYVVVRRQPLPTGPVSVLQVDLRQAWAAPGSVADLPLQLRDRVIVPTRAADRAEQLKSLTAELRAQGRKDDPARVVIVQGKVASPGEYPLSEGMRVADLLKAGGALAESALEGQVELIRHEVVDGDRRQTDLLNVDLSAVRNGDAQANVPVRPFDQLTVKQLEDWNETRVFTIRGEVRYPGSYVLRKGETLASVIKRAGGFTDEAFPAGAVFTRSSVAVQEKQQLERLAERLQGDLTVMAVRSAQGPTQQGGGDIAGAMAAGQALLKQVKDAQGIGRVVVDLQRVVRESASDVLLLEGDALVVPRKPQSVSVVGEVQNPVAHLWRPNAKAQDYLALSGGTTDNADTQRMYVVRADGSVLTRSGGWLGGGGIGALRPGDTLVVPVNADRMRALPLWGGITQILYQLAIATATIKTL
jgi:polysaccharide biosynthesis/export protein